MRSTRWLAAWLLLMLAVWPSVPVYAVDASQSYTFTVTADALEQTVGDTAGLAVSLSKDGGDNTYVMYASSVVLRYNGAMFEAGQIETAPGVIASVSDLSGSWEGWKAVTLNVLVSNVEGEVWENPTKLASISLRSVGQGVSSVSLQNGIVSTVGGMDSYEVHLGEITLKVRSDQKEPDRPGGSGTPGGPSGPSGSSNPSDPSNPAQPTEAVQEPNVTVEGEGGTYQLSEDGTMVTLLPKEGFRVKQVTLNGLPQGTGTVLSGLKTGDSIVVSFEKGSEPVAGEITFSDVASDAWYAPAVKYVAEHGYFNGTGERTFSPEQEMTRAMFVTVLGRIAGVDSEKDQVASFGDVPAGQWYSAYVQWASENGIVNGYDADHFGPADSITREQMSTIMYRYAKYAGTDTVVTDSSKFHSFYDASQVSPYAEEAMIWAVGRSVINGMGDNTLAPQATATRAQVAQIIWNYTEKIS